MTKRTVKLFLTVAALALVVGCATIPPENPICDQEEYADSWICQQLTAHNVYAEDARDLILDTRDIGLILEYYTEDQVRGAASAWRGYLNGGLAVTYTGLFDLITDDLSKAKRVAAIVSRRFGMMQSMELIRPADVKLLNLALDEIENL